MKILITGSSGMVGKNIIELHNSNKYSFISPSRQELNLLDGESVNKYIKSNKPQMVIHCAGVVGGIQANVDNPYRYFIDNSYMGLNVITASKKYGVKSLLNLGSSCMYPRDAKNPLSENQILKGELEPTNEGYAIAKVASAKLCEYISAQNKKYIYKTVIPCNLYGKFDKFDLTHSHLIPAVIRKIHEAKTNKLNSITVWGNGSARREFMYAGDFAEFIYYAINNFKTMPQNINVGIGHDYSITEYYQKIAKVIGYRGKFTYDLSKPTGMKQKLIDNTALIKFGWKPKISLDKGIEETYKYYLNEVEK